MQHFIASGVAAPATSGLSERPGSIVHWNGTQWMQVTSGTSVTLYGIWGRNSSDIWGSRRWRHSAALDRDTVDAGLVRRHRHLDRCMGHGRHGMDCRSRGRHSPLEWLPIGWRKHRNHSHFQAIWELRLLTFGLWRTEDRRSAGMVLLGLMYRRRLWAICAVYGEALQAICGRLVTQDRSSGGMELSGNRPSSGNDSRVFHGMWGVAPNDAWLVGGTAGNTGLIWHWNGSRLAAREQRVYAAAECHLGSSASDPWAVGKGGTVLHRVGGVWVPVVSGVSDELWAIWGAGPDDIWSVGLSGRVIHYTSGSWSRVTSGTSQYLFGIWGAAANDIWFVGSLGTIGHYDGVSWASASSGTTQDLHAIHGRSANDIWTIGNGGTIRHYDGTAWTNSASGVSNSLYGVWEHGLNDIWVVGNEGTMLHYNGTAWSRSNSGTTQGFGRYGAQSQGTSGVWGTRVC